jgi:putative transferase (TIGR04331 family)
MFLATTALSEFWDKKQEILFLGTWCVPYDRRPELESLDFRVLPLVWDDRELFYHTAQYLDERYEALIEALGAYLNTVHGVSHGHRYWRIILGPWLRRYLHGFYDRYYYVKEAFRHYPELETYVLNESDYRAPVDMLDFSKNAGLDVQNLQFFSQVLTALGHTYRSRTLESGWPKPNPYTAQPTRAGRLAGWSKWSGRQGLRFLEGPASRLLSKTASIALCEMYQSRRETWSVVLRSGFRAAPLVIPGKWSFPTPVPQFNDARNGLQSVAADDEFGSVFVKSLPHNFPTLYLEGYEQARDETLDRHSKFPKVLVSQTGWYFSEGLKFLAAEASEKGSRLVASQHGGFYGMVRSMPDESHESKLSDSYVVWGWANSESGNQRSLPGSKMSAALSIQRKKDSNVTDDTISFVTVTGPRYLLKFLSSPVGGQWEEYFEWESRFLSALSEDAMRRIVLRPLPRDYGWNLKDRISKEHPNVKWDDGRPFVHRLKQSSLLVIDNPVTTFLEAMAANVPSVLFWDPSRWEMREEAEAYIQMLRDAGILWDLPEEAAAKVDEIRQDPWEWWGTSQVQKARETLGERYALARKDWAKQWSRALKEEAALQKRRK